MVEHMRVAIFDFDGTLYMKETFQILMSHLKKHPTYKRRYNRFFSQVLPRFIAYKSKLYPEDRMKRRSMQLYLDSLHGLSVSEIDSFFREIVQKMQQDYNDEIISRIKKHQQNNDYIMLVSGAFTNFLIKAVKDLPFDQIIGSDIPFHNGYVERGRELYLIQAKRKREQVYRALEKKTIDWENSYSYGDSYSDKDVLEIVGHPVATRPDKKLRALAKEKNWQII